MYRQLKQMTSGCGILSRLFSGLHGGASEMCFNFMWGCGRAAVWF